MNNVVFFGPTHSGKSTMLGYIGTCFMDEKEFALYEKKLIAIIQKKGFPYDIDDRFRYFTDQGRDEIPRNQSTDTETIGTTKRLHRRKWTNIKTAAGEVFDAILIDTPGSDRTMKHRNAGIFEANIGVCLIDLSDFVKLIDYDLTDIQRAKLKDRIFSPLYQWKVQKNIKKLVIALTQIDRWHYNAYDYSRAADIIRSHDSFSSVPIVPVSIDIYSREDHNVNKLSDNTLWYSGKTLINIITSMFEEEEEANRENELLVYVYQIVKIRETLEPVLVVKVLSGEMKVSSHICLGPIRYGNEIVYTRCRVRSVKRIGSVETQEELEEDAIGGVCVSIYEHNKNLSDFNLKRTSIIFKDKAQYIDGNLLTFAIPKESMSVKTAYEIEQLLPKDSVDLIWLGKMIPMWLAGYSETKDAYELTLINQNILESLFCMPLSPNGRFLYDEFAIRLLSRKFLNAHLLRIEKFTADEVCQANLIIRMMSGYQEDIDTHNKIFSLKPSIQTTENRQEFHITSCNHSSLGSILGAVREYTKKMHKSTISYELKYDFEK